MKHGGTPPPGFGGFGSRLSSRISLDRRHGLHSGVERHHVAQQSSAGEVARVLHVHHVAVAVDVAQNLEHVPGRAIRHRRRNDASREPACRCQAFPRDVREHEVGRDLVGGRVDRRQRDCFRRAPVPTTRRSPRNMPAVELTATVATPMPTAAESEDGAGSEMRPA